VVPRPLDAAVGGLFVAAAATFLALATLRVGAGPLPEAAALGGAGLAGLAAVGVGHRELSAADREPESVCTRGRLAGGLAVAAGGPVTYLVSTTLGQGPVVASALVGLVAGLALAPYAAPVYCGSFVGMVSATVLPTLAPVVAASLAAGVVYVLAGRVFDGFGGKLGTIAFLGVGAVVVPLPYGYAAGAPLAPVAVLAALVAGTAGAVGTAFVGRRRGHGPVVGSAVVGLSAGLLAPPALGTAGTAAAAAAFAGSFAGMATRERLPGLAAVALAGLLSGGLYAGLATHFGGAGGKLGTVAFSACLLVSLVTGAGADRR
jgi:hypothetical protein